MKKDGQNIAEQLARFSKNIHFKNLPDEVIHEVKRRLIDTLGCALGAWTSKPCQIARKIASRSPLKKGATLIGTSLQTTPDLAAFANGAAVRYLDYNDTYLSKEPAHPSDNISAALSVAESVGANGKSLIEAIVIAYETQCRLCDAAALRPRGWDHVTYGSFSTALLSAKLLKLSEAKTVHALGLSGNANNALRQTRVGHLSMWKGLAFANAARNGVFAAELAHLGMTGPAPIFEGEKGFMKIVSGLLEWPTLSDTGPFKIMETYIKYFPVEYHAQSAVQATLSLRQKLPKDFLSQVSAIRVRTSDISYEIIGNDPDKWHPQSRETADHSLPYIVAVSLKDGKMGLPQFNAKHLADPELSSLIQKVKIFSDKKHSELYGETMGNTVSVKIGDQSYSEKVERPRGFPGNLMTDEEVEAKFRRLAKTCLSQATIDDCLKQLWRLEKLGSIHSLLARFQIKT